MQTKLTITVAPSAMKEKYLLLQGAWYQLKIWLLIYIGPKLHIYEHVKVD
jgi:hypothetical protein